MAVSITNNMSLWSNADGISLWTSTGGGFAAYTDIMREGAGCIGDQASSGTLYGYYLKGSTDISDSTLFGWARSGNPTAQSSGGFMLVAGDTSGNMAAYYVGGSDNYGLFFNGWSSFKMDCSNPPASFNTISGSETNIDWTTINEAGVGFNYASKASGNSDNVFIDKISYIANGSPALTIAGGTVSDVGTFSEVVAWEELLANATGIIASAVPGAKAYALHYGVDIGDSGTGTSYFVDTSFQLFLIGAGMKAGSMDITILGNATGTNYFELTNFIIESLGTPANLDFSDVNVDNMLLYYGTINSAATISLPVYDLNKSVTNVTFNWCDPIDISTCTFTDNTIAFANTAGVTVPSGGGNDANNTYESCPVGKYYGTVGNYDIDGDTFSGCTFDIQNAGNAATITAGSFIVGRAYKILTVGTTDFTLIGAADNNIGTKFVATGVGTGTGTATEVLLINKLNGANPTTANNTGTNADTLILGSVPVTVTVLDDSTGLGINLAHVLLYLASDHTTQVLYGATNSSGVITGSWSGSTPVDITGWARQADLSGVDYEPVDIGGTVTTTGFNVTVRLKPTSI